MGKDMRKIATILFIICFVPLAAQNPGDVTFNTKGNATRIILTNAGAVTLNAVGDALRDEAWATHNSTLSKWGHLANAGSVGLTLTLPLNQGFDTREWIWYVVSYAAMRVAIFDPVYNLVRGNEWNYHGTSSNWDRILGEIDPGDGLIVARGVAFSIAVTIPIHEWGKNRNKYW